MLRNLTIYAVLLLAAATAHAADPYRFELLGEPMRARTATVSVVTTAGTPIAWGTMETPEIHDVVGIEIETGKSIQLGVKKFGETHMPIHRAANGNLYIYSGRPSHWLKYDPAQRKLTDLGAVVKEGYYHHVKAEGPDGRVWVGSFPGTELAWLDPATDKIGSFGRIAEDEKEKYIPTVAVSDDNIVYCAVGLHHAELWAVNAETGDKKMILPEELTKRQGSVSLFLGKDGEVYGSSQGKQWRCTPAGVEFVEKLPEGRDMAQNRFGGERFVSINPEGQLVARKGNTERTIETDLKMPHPPIYVLGPMHDGKVWGGGGWHRATLFTYDPATGKLEDLGIQGAGSVQVYDVLAHPRGIFMTSYSGGGIDFYEPETGKLTPVAVLAREHQQERPEHTCIGPDGMIYMGSVPVKGLLGGTLTRVDPKDLSVKVWRNIVPDQSISQVLAVPSTGEVFFASGIRGGTSAIPTQKEAFVGFWDTKNEKIAWQGQPLKTANFGQAALGRDGMIYGIAADKFYVLDPKTRETVKVGDLPVERVRPLALHDAPAGPDGLIYGLGEDALFAIDPATDEARILARHPSIRRAQGILVTDDGTVYYGSEAELWRAVPAG